MQNIITFIIPVRHPENARDWGKQKRNLTATVGSIANQSEAGWRAVIVANHGSDLPELPAGFEVKWVDFPPNRCYEKDRNDLAKVNEAVRLDKGRRILAGLLHARSNMGYAMVVDDDDFISRDLTAYIRQHPGTFGWFVKDGYVWTDGGHWLFLHDDFSNLCGSSHIIRSDLLDLPQSLESASEEYIKNVLGSHLYIHGLLSERGTPLVPLPFPGAVYRAASAESHSQSSGILRHFFFKRSVLANPLLLLRRLTRVRSKSMAMERQFFGG